jgi:hypothetical protein
MNSTNSDAIFNQLLGSLWVAASARQLQQLGAGGRRLQAEAPAPSAARRDRPHIADARRYQTAGDCRRRSDRNACYFDLGNFSAREGCAIN